MDSMKAILVAAILAMGMGACGGNTPLTPAEMCDPGQCAIYCAGPNPTYCVDSQPCDPALYCPKK